MRPMLLRSRHCPCTSIASTLSPALQRLRTQQQAELRALEHVLVKLGADESHTAVLRDTISNSVFLLCTVGEFNAGKSSLLNALAGAELAIVSAVAGTTRDVVSQTIQIQGVPLHVVDTAGLRDSQDEVEKIGIARAWSQIAGADAVLFLHDLTRHGEREWQSAEDAIRAELQAQLPASVPVLEVWNKLDARRDVPSEGLAGAVALSARTGEGLEELRQRLLQLAGWQSVAEGVYMARERHVQALRRVQTHLEDAGQHLAAQAGALDLLAEELRLAQNALNEITGEFTPDDLLGVIFSSFCIGK